MFQIFPITQIYKFAFIMGANLNDWIAYSGRVTVSRFAHLMHRNRNHLPL